MQRVTHLGAEGVASSQSGRLPAGRDNRGQKGIEDRRAVVPRRQQLVAAFTGVSGPAHPHRILRVTHRQLGIGEGHVVHLRRHAQVREHLRRAWALNRDDTEVAMTVPDLDPGRGNGRERRDHCSRVRGVRNHEHLVVGHPVDDQVVDDPAGVVGAQRVLGLARRDLVQIVGEGAVDELRSSRSGDGRLAEVTDVEYPDRLTHGSVLGDGARIGHRHVPSAECRETRAQRAVRFLDRPGQQFTFAHGVTLSRPRRARERGELGSTIGKHVGYEWE